MLLGSRREDRGLHVLNSNKRLSLLQHVLMFVTALQNSHDSDRTGQSQQRFDPKYYEEHIQLSALRCGSVVVEALCYKLEGRGIASR
jgi:hypothetical protein